MDPSDKSSSSIVHSSSHPGQAGDNQGQQPQQQVPQAPAAASVAPTVVPGGKEQGPTVVAPVAPDKAAMEAVPAVETPEVSPEVKEAGVEVAPDKPELHPDIQKIGVTHAQDAITPGGAPQDALHLPMTEVKAQEQLKTITSVTDPARWIAALVVKAYQVAKQRLSPKDVHGS